MRKAFVIIVIGLAAFAAWQLFWPSAPQRVPYSSFLGALQHKRISSVRVSGQSAEFKLLKGPTEQTVLPQATADLMKSMAENGVSVQIESTEGLPWATIGVATGVGCLGLYLYFWFYGRAMDKQKGATTSSRGKVIKKEQLAETFADVVGCETAKKELLCIVEYLKDPSRFAAFDAKVPKGVLLVGPPGTGKTMLARALAKEANASFLFISGADFVEMFVGVGAARVRSLFEAAKESSPCILFIDEIDAVGRSRGTGIGGSHDEREQTLNQLLIEMDGFLATKGIVVVAATNRPDMLDTALTRSGRFDYRVAVESPDAPARARIFDLNLKKVASEGKLASDVDYVALAKRTHGFTGADIANLANQTKVLAATQRSKNISMADFDTYLDKLFPSEKSLRDLSRQLGEKVRGAGRAKSVIAAALQSHFGYLRHPLADPAIQWKKPNALLVGPRSAGRRGLVEAAAKILEVPMVIISADQFGSDHPSTVFDTTTGQRVMRDMFAAAGGNLMRAEHGIVCVTDVDKVVGSQYHRSAEAQDDIARLMAGAKVDLNSHNLVSDSQSLRLSTNNVLFILEGHLPTLEEAMNDQQAGHTPLYLAGGEGLMGSHLLRKSGFAKSLATELSIAAFVAPLSDDEIRSITQESWSKDNLGPFDAYISRVSAGAGLPSAEQIAKESIEFGLGLTGLGTLLSTAVLKSFLPLEAPHAQLEREGAEIAEDVLAKAVDLGFRLSTDPVLTKPLAFLIQLSADSPDSTGAATFAQTLAQTFGLDPLTDPRPSSRAYGVALIGSSASASTYSADAGREPLLNALASIRAAIRSKFASSKSTELATDMLLRLNAIRAVENLTHDIKVEIIDPLRGLILLHRVAKDLSLDESIRWPAEFLAVSDAAATMNGLQAGELREECAALGIDADHLVSSLRNLLDILLPPDPSAIRAAPEHPNGGIQAAAISRALSHTGASGRIEVQTQNARAAILNTIHDVDEVVLGRLPGLRGTLDHANLMLDSAALEVRKQQGGHEAGELVIFLNALAEACRSIQTDFSPAFRYAARTLVDLATMSPALREHRLKWRWLHQLDKIETLCELKPSVETFYSCDGISDEPFDMNWSTLESEWDMTFGDEDNPFRKNAKIAAAVFPNVHDFIERLRSDVRELETASQAAQASGTSYAWVVNEFESEALQFQLESHRPANFTVFKQISRSLGRRDQNKIAP